MNNYKIYLDNCTFNRPFDKRNQLSIVLEADAKLYKVFQKKNRFGVVVYFRF